MLLFVVATIFLAVRGNSPPPMEPVTHQAARLISFGEEGVEREYTTSSYGSTAGSAQDLYTHMYGNQIKIYNPEIFKRLREGAGVSKELYQQCLTPDLLECLSEKMDSKSGQALWRSSDASNTIVLKTIKRYECKNMRDIIAQYAVHMDTNPHSCISGIVGLYRIRLKSGKKVYFIAMKNVFSGSGGSISRNKQDMLLCDLKGSTVGRAKSATSSVLKDQDILDVVYVNNPIASLWHFKKNRPTPIQQSNLQEKAVMLNLGLNAKSTLMHALEQDVAFLGRYNFMDYR